MKQLSKGKKLLLAVIAAVVILLAAVYAFYMNALSPVNRQKEDVTFVVESGEGFADVLDHLAEADLIKNKTIASLHARISGQTQVMAGIFTLNDSKSTDEILQILNDPAQAKQDQVLITFPEGKWAKDYAALIERQLGIPAETLLTKWNDAAYIETLAADYAFLDVEALNNDDYKVKLEGYLFPETYAFDKDADADAITRTFLDHFQTIYAKYEKQFEQSELSVHEVVALASVVQYESASKEDMKSIAGVFFNRLAQDMPLQSTVTVCYALYDDLDRDDTESWKKCESSTDIDSPYNTYLHSGLPIGPIVNPGEEAIDAVLEPEDNDYLFFIADVKGDGKVYYSETYEEHQKLQQELDLIF